MASIDGAVRVRDQSEETIPGAFLSCFLFGRFERLTIRCQCVERGKRRREK